MTEVYWKPVADFPLPKGEGVLHVTVKTEMADLPLSEIDVQAEGVAYYHKPHCHGRGRVARVGVTKTVLFCRDCGLRFDLKNGAGQRPGTLQGLGEILNEMLEAEHHFATSREDGA